MWSSGNGCATRLRCSRSFAGMRFTTYASSAIRFDFDIELVGKLIRQGYSPLEVDISYNSRSFNEGKKVSVLRDPPTWVKACLKHRFSRLHLWPGST